MLGGEKMANGSVEINDLEGLIKTGRKLAEYSEEYSSCVNSLYSATEYLRQYWQGQWSTEHLDKVEGYKISLMTLATKLESLGKAIEKAGSGYSDLG